MLRELVEALGAWVPRRRDRGIGEALWCERVMDLGFVWSVFAMGRVVAEG